jgi:hypothetical protein
MRTVREREGGREGGRGGAGVCMVWISMFGYERNEEEGAGRGKMWVDSLFSSHYNSPLSPSLSHTGIVFIVTGRAKFTQVRVCSSERGGFLFFATACLSITPLVLIPPFSSPFE